MSVVDLICAIAYCHRVQKLGRGMCRALEEESLPDKRKHLNQPRC